MNTTTARSAPREEDFPAQGRASDKLRFAASYAVLAPSSHNTQPWHFLIHDDSVLVCADRTRALPVVDPYDRELIISCGAALLNLRVALAHFGCAYQIATFPYPSEPDVLAEVRLREPGFLDRELGPLLPALKRRVTNRNDFSEDEVPEPLQLRMQQAAAAEGAGLALIAERARRERIAELVAEADRTQFSQPGFRRELAAWIHPTRRGDGMPAYALGMSQLLDMATPLVSAVVRTFDVGGGVAASHERLAQGSPLIACLSTPVDDPPAWLAAGQALERLLLVAADAWFDASYLNQPVEVPALRLKLRDLAGSDGLPQILLRIGSGRAPQSSPRRPVAEVFW